MTPDSRTSSINNTINIPKFMKGEINKILPTLVSFLIRVYNPIKNIGVFVKKVIGKTNQTYTPQNSGLSGKKMEGISM